jgi:hypothetical protein
MDIEFHYTLTYLIAARAGFAPEEATIVAQAAQEIDDNHIPIAVSAGTEAAYDGTLSQTMDILRPLHDEKIYPIFHFIPGEPDAPMAKRKDGATSLWMTTPNSPLANEMLDTALASGDFYRIGASAHAFCDTWAHQNFLGKDDVLNEMPEASLVGRIEGAIPLMRIGHALAGHKPDIVGLIWRDGRLETPLIDNSSRFLDAAAHLFCKFYDTRGGARAERERLAAELVADLGADIGPSSETSRALDPARMVRYRQRALSPEYGGQAIAEYRVAKWADEALVEQRAQIRTKLALYLEEHAGRAGDILGFGTRMACTWKDPAHYRETHWYRFQEAVKAHRDECWAVLVRRLPEIAR